MLKPWLKLKGTLILHTSKDRRPAIARAAALLAGGGLVAFPTETVYGLAAAINCPGAVARIFEVKGRPADNPLIVHISSLEQLFEVASAVSPEALRLCKRFWPGPLSLVLPRSTAITPVVSAGLPTVAVRMPAHPLALELITATGAPLAAPSANLSGRPSPTTAAHVLEDLAGKIDAVLDGGACRVGVESTVLDLTGPRPVILRPGGITREALEQFLKVPLRGIPGGKPGEPPRSPGMKYRHYSPRAPLILITGPPHRREKLIRSLAGYYRARGRAVAILRSPEAGQIPGESIEAMARLLYAALRAYDSHKVELILAEETCSEGIGLAVMNRLRKAATRVIKA